MENLIDERYCKCYGNHRLDLSCSKCHRRVNIFEKDMRIQQLKAGLNELNCLKEQMTKNIKEMQDIIMDIIN